MNSAGHTEAIFWLRPLISVSRRVAYVIDLGVGGVKGYPNWTGGIELRWVDTGGQIWTGVDWWVEGWMGGFGVEGWAQG